VYVAQITEDAAAVDATSTNVRRRTWELLARKYQGHGMLFGTDVRCVLSGEEERLGPAETTRGRSKLELAVRAKVHDAATRAAVDAACASMARSLGAELERLSVERDAEAALRSQPGLPSQPAGIGGFIQPDLSGAAEGGASGARSRRRQLERKMELLESAILEGRISESLYVKLRAEIESRLSAPAAEPGSEGKPPAGSGG
jgi:hypothetical protein